jgi:hypothetical protein
MRRSPRPPSVGPALLALLLLQSAPSLAQEPPEPGTRVRLDALDADARPTRTIGTVLEAGVDSVVVVADRREERAAIPWHAVMRFDESTGRRSRGRTVLLSAGLLAAGGAGMAWIIGEDCGNVPRGELCLLPREEFAVAMGVFGAATGVVAGLLAPRQETWRPRAVPGRIRVTGGAPGRPGIAAVLAL